jgi:hypothetical protein
LATLERAGNSLRSRRRWSIVRPCQSGGEGTP